MTKYCGKKEKLLLKLLLRSNFSPFPQYFQDISIFRSQFTYSFVKCYYSIYFFLNFVNLICRGTDISKYVRESLGLWDNESRLYDLPYFDERYWKHCILFTLSNRTDRPEQIVLAQIRCYTMKHLIWAYTVCHLSSSFCTHQQVVKWTCWHSKGVKVSQKITKYGITQSACIVSCPFSDIISYGMLLKDRD